MKRIVFFLVAALAWLAWTTPVAASCCTTATDPTCNKPFSRDYFLSNSGTAQCKGPNALPIGTYTVKCTYESEINSKDSVEGPLCGTQAEVPEENLDDLPELGMANSSCWVCGTDLKCAGLGQALGDTDNALFENKLEVPGNDINHLWRVETPPASFMYNGMRYDMSKYGTEGVVVCDSNVTGCGDPEGICFNYNFNDIGPGAGKKRKQCTNLVPLVREMPVAQDTDVNLDARGAAHPANEPMQLIDVGGPTDDAAPQFSTLFGEVPILNPSITGVFQLNLNDGVTLIPRDDSSNWGVTQIQLAGSTVYSPKSGWPIGYGYHYMVLYADEGTGTLTLKATLEDDAVSGYTLHFTNLDIDDDILRLYQQADQAGRTQLPAISCGYPIGTAKGGNFRIAVADTGTFIDPRVRKDWWKTPPPDFAIAPCTKKIGLVTASHSMVARPNYKGGIADARYQRVGEADISDTINFAEPRDPPIGNLVVGISQIAARLLGHINPLNQKTNAPPFTKESRQLAGAWPMLAPKAIQDQTVNVPEVDCPGDEPMAISISSSLCAPQSEKKKKFLPIGIWETIFIDYSPFVQFARLFVSTRGRNPLDNLDFRAQFPNRIIQDKNGPECEEADDGKQIATTAFTNLNKHNYDDEEGELYTPDVQLGPPRVAELTGLISKFLCFFMKDQCNPTTGRKKYLKFGSYVPYSNETNDNVGGDTMGFTNTILPKVILDGLASTNAKTRQRFEHSAIASAPDPITGTLVYNQLAAMKESIAAMNCALLPKEKQPAGGATCRDKNFIETVPNTSDWALPGAPQTPIEPDFTVPAGTVPIQQAIVAAAGGSIPQCVLEGVAYIEGGYNWDSSTTVCRPNVCSAAGPFQITVGQDATGDTQCKKCGPSWADGSRTCPDAWPNDWPDDTNATSPCDMQAAADQAVQVLQSKASSRGHTLDNRPPSQQRQTIIQAGNDYYGSGVSIPRLGGCSYGEFVYKHCVPSYQCGAR